MRIFKTKDGGVVQLVDKKKMQEWPVELPLLFVEYIRDTRAQIQDLRAGGTEEQEEADKLETDFNQNIKDAYTIRGNMDRMQSLLTDDVY